MESQYFKGCYFPKPPYVSIFSMTSNSSMSESIEGGYSPEVLFNGAYGQLDVFFNVSKIFVKIDQFKFESRLEVKCGHIYNLEIVQTGNETYKLTEKVFNSSEIEEVVRCLFNDMLLCFEESKKYGQESGGWISQIPLSDDVLKTYLSTPNYVHLAESCRITI